MICPPCVGSLIGGKIHRRSMGLVKEKVCKDMTVQDWHKSDDHGVNYEVR